MLPCRDSRPQYTPELHVWWPSAAYEHHVCSCDQCICIDILAHGLLAPVMTGAQLSQQGPASLTQRVENTTAYTTLSLQTRQREL